ncbi:MAG: hypothetical protein JWN73_2186 [Betaproteobacteria bacterium]|nr:hypothetical protein [Betaproteobacteria bacterium]
MTQTRKRPSEATTKRLFAKSGNQCAFPKCNHQLVVDNSVVGVICHIKAASANGPRYDKDQAPAERHEFANLIILCPIHHKVIDDDPESFTVERLTRMKVSHEQDASPLSAEQIDRGAELLVDQSVRSLNQIGGITAHSVVQNIYLQPPISSESTETNNSISSRFFKLLEEHGVHRNQIPRFVGHDVSLSDVQHSSTLLPKLTEKLLDDICARLAIRREWLDGADSRVHLEHDFYKSPQEFDAFLTDLKAKNIDGDFSGVLLFPLPGRAERDSNVLLIIQECIGSIGPKPIYRYHLCNNWIYGYWKSRAYLTACVAIAWRLNVYVHGLFCEQKTIDALAYGETLMGWSGEGIWALRGRRWYAEDMALIPREFLKGLDPERKKEALGLALELWLKLDDAGHMNAGFEENVSLLFHAELAKYLKN